MAFTPKDWHNLPATDTDISAEALIDLENRLAGYADSQVSTVAANLGQPVRFNRISTVEANVAGQYEFDQVSVPTQPQPDSFTSIVERDTSTSFTGSASLHCKVAKPGGGGTSTGYGYSRGHFENPTSSSTAFRVNDELWTGAAYKFATNYFSEKASSSDILRIDAYVDDGGNLRPITDQQHLAIEFFGDDTLHVVANDRNGTVVDLVAGVLPPTLAEAQWHWIEMHVVLSTVDGNALTELYIDGDLVGSSDKANMFAGHAMFNRVRYGIVSTGTETGTLELWTDRAYVGPKRRPSNRLIPGANNRLQYGTSDMPKRSIIKFSGLGVGLIDDPANDTTAVNISGSGGGGGSLFSFERLPAGALVQTAPIEISTSTISLGASDRIQCAGIVTLKAGVTYSAVHFFNGNTAGAGLTHRWGGVVRLSDRQVKGISADNTTATTTADTALDFTFGTPYMPSGDEDHLCFINVVGTTLPNLRGVSGSTNIMALVPGMAVTSNNGLTTPPALNTVLAAFSSTNVKPYAWLT